MQAYFTQCNYHCCLPSMAQRRIEPAIPSKRSYLFSISFEKSISIFCTKGLKFCLYIQMVLPFILTRNVCGTRLVKNLLIKASAVESSLIIPIWLSLLSKIIHSSLKRDFRPFLLKLPSLS